MKQQNKIEKTVSFEYYAPGAKHVQLAGTFNNWNASKCPLRQDKEGWWRIELKLEPGRYEYRYLVDGCWENDQRPVQCIPNPFGSWNCAVEVS